MLQILEMILHNFVGELRGVLTTNHLKIYNHDFDHTVKAQDFEMAQTSSYTCTKLPSYFNVKVCNNVVTERHNVTRPILQLSW